MGPGHCSLKGMTQDYDKLLFALLANWKVIYLTSQHLTSKKFPTVVQALELFLDLAPAPTTYIPYSKRAQNNETSRTSNFRPTYSRARKRNRRTD